MIRKLIMTMALAALLCGAAWADPVQADNDTDIRMALSRELYGDEAVSGHNVDITVVQGVVTLDGEVDNLLAKDRAVEIARAIKGVRSVVDEVEVEAVDRKDGDIRSDVVTALALDPAADSYELTVSVSDGVVTLTGTVESWQEQELSLRVARGVRGVEDVVDNITVDYDAERLDREIRKDIERRLETDVSVDEYLIDVEVEDGEVSLSGTVGSAAEKWDAHACAWVKGTESVDIDGLDVEPWAEDEMMRRTPPALTDSEIADAVRDAFVYDPRVFSFRPTVSVVNGVVTLMGSVSSLSAKKAAEDTAMNTVGVRRVKNYLTVRPDVNVVDADTTQRVRDALRRDPYLDRYDFTVSTYNGKVYLYGTVDTLFDSWHAEYVASSVDGVTEVHNGMTVRGDWVWATDEAIYEDVRDELFWSPWVDSEDVTVTVVDGTVSLLGTVDSWFEFRKAVENAWEGGAKDVRAKLHVRHNGD